MKQSPTELDSLRLLVNRRDAYPASLEGEPRLTGVKKANPITNDGVRRQSRGLRE